MMERVTPQLLSSVGLTLYICKGPTKIVFKVYPFTNFLHEDEKCTDAGPVVRQGLILHHHNCLTKQHLQPPPPIPSQHVPQSGPPTLPFLPNILERVLSGFRASAPGPGGSVNAGGRRRYHHYFRRCWTILAVRFHLQTRWECFSTLVIARAPSASPYSSAQIGGGQRTVAVGVRSDSGFAADGPATTRSNQFATPCSSTLGEDDNDVAASARIPLHRIPPVHGASALGRASSAPPGSHNFRFSSQQSIDAFFPSILPSVVPALQRELHRWLMRRPRTIQTPAVELIAGNDDLPAGSGPSSAASSEASFEASSNSPLEIGQGGSALLS